MPECALVAAWRRARAWARAGVGSKKSVFVIAATNRPHDLDAALLSRFDVTIRFPLPADAQRRQLFELYAHHLAPAERARLAAVSPGASGRDIRDICQAAERKWAASRVRGEARAKGRALPPVEEYERSLRERQAAALERDAMQ